MKQGGDITCPKLITKRTKEATQRERQQRKAGHLARIAKIVAEEEAKCVPVIHKHNNNYWSGTKYQPSFESYIAVSFTGTCC